MKTQNIGRMSWNLTGWASGSSGCRRNRRRPTTPLWRKRMDKLTRRKDMTKLRLRMDGDDNFMSSHQIKKTRVLFGQKDTPPWAASNEEVRRILLTAFPNLGNDQYQHKAAARWSQAITLVYR